MPNGWCIALAYVISLNGNNFPISANLPCLPISMIRFSDIMLIYQYRKNQPIYRYRDSLYWFTNIGQLGHLPISKNRISDIRKYNLHFTEMNKRSCAHTTVSSHWKEFLAVENLWGKYTKGSAMQLVNCATKQIASSKLSSPWSILWHRCVRISLYVVTVCHNVTLLYLWIWFFILNFSVEGGQYNGK